MIQLPKASDKLRDAACKDLPENDKRAFYALNSANLGAKRVCQTCPVRMECLKEAVAFEPPGERYGVWGGLSARERDQLFG
jgi:WhiB family redox-sensing transcriptional regulator